MKRHSAQDRPHLRIAIVGAGWAGCAAAVELGLRGHAVTVFEAARQPGGRARALLRATDPGSENWQAGLDNGQHILLGAYTETLRLMRAVGSDPLTQLLRLPLQMRYPPGADGMDFHCPRLPAPLHLAIGLLRTRGLSRADKLGLARFSTTARWIDWRLNIDCSVAELLARFDQTQRAIDLLWRPLCLAALNTPPEHASAQVFLNVLRDSLGARRAASDMLLPRTDLGSLFPAPALDFIAQHGGQVRLGCRVRDITREADLFRLHLTAGADRNLAADADADAAAGTCFDRLIVALPAAESTRLLARCGADRPLEGADARLPDAVPADVPMRAVGVADAFQGAAEPTPGAEAGSELSRAGPQRLHEPITTCYLRYASEVALAQPLYALRDDVAAGHPGQFVFDRGQLDAAQRGIMAVVISASESVSAIPAATLAQMIAAQLAEVFGDPRLRTPLASRVVAEKRATFSCTPGLIRLPAATGVAGLFRAGDHVAGDYPATIEGAVRSGVAAARLALDG